MLGRIRESVWMLQRSSYHLHLGVQVAHPLLLLQLLLAAVLLHLPNGVQEEEDEYCDL